MSSNIAAAPAPQYVRAPAVQRMLGGITRQTLADLVEAGTIPPPAEMNSRLHLYDLNAVVEAVKKRQRGRG